MTTSEKSWGRSLEIISRPQLDDNGRMINSAGINYVNSQSLIPLHVHTEDCEEYIPQTAGMKILVVTQEEAKEMTDEELVRRMKALKPTGIGDVVVCPRGSAHALFNTSWVQGSLVYIKY